MTRFSMNPIGSGYELDSCGVYAKAPTVYSAAPFGRYRLSALALIHFRSSGVKVDLAFSILTRGITGDRLPASQPGSCISARVKKRTSRTISSLDKDSATDQFSSGCVISVGEAAPDALQGRAIRALHDLESCFQTYIAGKAKSNPTSW